MCHLDLQDNVSVFLKACGKLGLNVSQLFDPGDLQDLSNRVTLRHNESKRRLKNVLITIYWLGRKAHLDAYYSGPQLNFKAFEGLLGLALSRALDEGANLKDGWCPEREEDTQPRRSCRSQTSVDSIESLEPRNLLCCATDIMRIRNCGCGSDAEAEQVFKMETTQDSPRWSRGRIPPLPPQRKQSLENGQSCTSPLARYCNNTDNEERPSYAPQTPLAIISSSDLSVIEETFFQALSEEDSDDDFAEADPVQDDLYFRRLQQTRRQTSSCPRFDRFLPQYWTPEEEARVHTIYLGSRRRPWYHKMQQLSQRALRSTMEECSTDFFSWFLASRTVPPGSAEVQNLSADLKRGSYAEASAGFALVCSACMLKKFEKLSDAHHNFWEIKPRILTTLNLVPPITLLKANLLTATQLSRLTFCRPQPRYYLVQVLAAVIPTAAAAAICSVTLLDFARCSPAHTWLRSLLLGCRMCHIAAVIRMQCNGAVMSSVQSVVFGSVDLFQLSASLSVLTRSKSLSDIPMVYPVCKVPNGRMVNDVRGENGVASDWNHGKPQCTTVAEDAEAQWQDDLTKWKNRRRSTKSDDCRKSQDREHVIHQMTNSAETNFEKNEAGVPLERCSYDILLFKRSTAGAMPASDGTILVEDTPFASLASEGAGVTTPSLEFPFSSQTQVKGQSSPAPMQPSSKPADSEKGPTSQISSLVTTLQPNGATAAFDKDPTELCAGPKVPPFFPDEVHQASVYTTDNRHNLSTSEMGSWAHSASLPRGYRRSESSCRLSSAITARPYSSRQSKASSLPRLQHVDDNQGLLSKQKNDTRVDQSGGEQLGAATDATPFQTQSPLQVGLILQDNPGESPTLPSAPCSDHTKAASARKSFITFMVLVSVRKHRTPNLRVLHFLCAFQVGHSVMRVSLTLKPDSRSDFGVQTHWDSTGARVQFIQPGSPAELCQLRVDDEIVALNGVSVAHMSSSQWMEKLTSSLRAGSLTMDVRRYGNKGEKRSHKKIDWSSGVGSHRTQPGQSRTTLNLTASTPALIDCPTRPASHGNPAENPIGTASELSGQTNGASGRLELRNNHKRRAEFFQTGGSESAISDLQVPSLSPSTSSWMWNYEEERKRQQKWQEEQERLLQDKYRRDQRRLEAEWQRAQQDAMEE
uniref:PDZ domain-containing protein n=1 Tax=Tetraodon nigroviridis TaxID=99883 RepID=H3CVL9_TETNG